MSPSSLCFSLTHDCHTFLGTEDSFSLLRSREAFPPPPHPPPASSFPAFSVPPITLRADFSPLFLPVPLSDVPSIPLPDVRLMPLSTTSLPSFPVFPFFFFCHHVLPRTPRVFHPYCPPLPSVFSNHVTFCPRSRCVFAHAPCVFLNRSPPYRLTADSPLLFHLPPPPHRSVFQRFSLGQSQSSCLS